MISSLPATSVLSLGMGHIVFKKVNNGFKAQKVFIAGTYGGKVQILSGISPKDTVARNAQFLMDSESFIQVNK